MQKTPIANPEIICRHIDGEAVLLDPSTGKYFGLNPVGFNIWQKIDGIKTIDEIIDMLLMEYQVEKDILGQDVAELIEALDKHSLVKWK